MSARVRSMSARGPARCSHPAGCRNRGPSCQSVPQPTARPRAAEEEKRRDEQTNAYPETPRQESTSATLLLCLERLKLYRGYLDIYLIASKLRDFIAF